MRWGVRKDRSSSKKSKPKRVEDMSDEELKKAVNRLNLEQNYTSLIAKKNERNQTAIQRGAKMVQKAVVDAAVQKGTQIAAKQMTKGLELASFVVMEAAKKRKK